MIRRYKFRENNPIKHGISWNTQISRVFTSALVIQLGCMLWGILGTYSGYAQIKDSLSRDSVGTTIVPEDYKIKKSVEDSIIYTKIKNRFSKNKILNEIYGALFKDVYNQNVAGQEIVKVEQNPFQEYEGRVIRHIYVKGLRVFGESVIDTNRKAKGFEKLLSAVHTNTQEGVIRKSFLMFNVGDIIDANRLRDNERLMRNSSILHDARIFVEPDDQYPNLVDLIVVTQDVWSLIPDVNFGGLNRFDISINQVNFRGLGHSWRNTFFMNYNEKPALEYATSYTIPYIGRSFITGQAELSFRRQTSRYALRFFRPFLTPEMKMAGGFEVSHDRDLRVTTRGYDATTLKINDTTLLYFPSARNHIDLWLGRSYKLPFLSAANQARTRLVVGIRYTGIHYTQRPQVTADTNQLFRDRSEYLFGIGFSNRRYKRDFLIYGFGITEDVPYGYLATFVAGAENSDAYGRRWYSGIKLARGHYLPKSGYLYALVNIGAYSNGTTGFSIESNYFSRLMSMKKAQLRHFVNFRYAFGTQRYTGEYLNINGENGIQGINSDKLWGSKKLTLGYQSVLFSRINFVGFRLAPFFQLDFAFVTPRNQFLFTKAPYTGVGLGIRLRNENLTFNTFQLKFTYFPNLPDIGMLNVAFSDTYNLRLKDFDISAPEIVPFR